MITGFAPKPMGSFVRMILAGSRGIARAPVPLGDIDLGADAQDLYRHLEHYRSASDELNVEQSRMWGALSLYCLTRCSAVGHPCPLLKGRFTAAQVATIRKGVDFWRLKEVAGASGAASLVDQLQVEEACPASAEGVDIAEGEPDDRDGASPVEVEWLPPRGETCRLRVRLNQTIESDPDHRLVARFLVAEPIGVAASLVGSAPGVMSQGEVGVLIEDEWQEISLRFTGLGEGQVRRIELVDLRGGGGQAIDLPPRSHPVAASPASTAPARAEAAADSEPTWAASVEGPETRALLLHLAKHGAVTEEEAVRLLGSHRALRRFSADFEAIIARVPFRVRIEATEAGKRYVREGDR